MKEQAKKTNRFMAEHLKILRQDADLTMRILADKLATPHSFIGKIEQQGRRLDVGEFIQYCQAMGCDPLDVLKSLIEHNNQAKN